MTLIGDVVKLNFTTSPIQTVDKVPGISRGFSFVVIHIFYIFSVFIKKKRLFIKRLFINPKVRLCFPSAWYNYLIRRLRL